MRLLAGTWTRRKAELAAAIAVIVGVEVSIGAFQALSDAGGAESGGETVIQCVQGRCIERAVGDIEAEAVVVTPEQEVENFGRQPPMFEEVGAQAGVDFHHMRDNDFFNLGGGAAAADFNNDGWVDIYVTNSNGPNSLYLNQGDGTFKDIADAAGVADATGRGNGAAWGDYDSDGFVDLFVANLGDSHLFRNNGNETFTDVTGLAGVRDPAPDYRTTGAVWGDYDDDGYLDLLVVRHVVTTSPMFTNMTTAQIVLLRQCRTEEFLKDPKVPRGVLITDPHDFSKTSKRDFSGVVSTLALYHNKGDGTFENVTGLLGINVYPSAIFGAGFKPAFLDYDNDGDFDIYVVNDFGDENIPNVLWRNDGPDGKGGWRFTDVSEATGANPKMYGMGLAAGDYDNDGDLDLHMTDIGQSRFFENRDGQFVEVTDRTGTGRGVIPENGEVNQSISWGAVFVDFDNDGWLDLYNAAGYLDSDPCASHPNQPNALFMNMGSGRFTDVSKSSGANDNGTGREVIAADFNNDGLQDIYVVNIGNLDGNPGIARLLLNTYQTDNAWLDVKPMNSLGTALATGAKVQVTVNGITHLQYTGLAQGHTSQSLLPVHFGLGQAQTADVVVIEWPDGRTERLEDVGLGQILEVWEP